MFQRAIMSKSMIFEWWFYFYKVDFDLNYSKLFKRNVSKYKTSSNLVWGCLISDFNLSFFEGKKLTIPKPSTNLFVVIFCQSKYKCFLALKIFTFFVSLGLNQRDNEEKKNYTCLKKMIFSGCNSLLQL